MSAPTLVRTDALGPQDGAAVIALLDGAEATDGVAPVGEQVVRAVRTGGGTHVLASVGPDLAGYAHVAGDPARTDTDTHTSPAAAPDTATDTDTAADTDIDTTTEVAEAPTVELAVHPTHRRAGIGAALVREVTSLVGADARFWAHGDLPAARALARTTGLTGVRDLLQLRLDLTANELPEVSTPAGVVLSTYSGPSDGSGFTDGSGSTDDGDLLAVNNAAFAWHPEQGGMTADGLAELRAQRWFDPRGLFLARDAADGQLLGFHWTKVHPAGPVEEGELGEVYVLGIAPGAQGRGLGRYLTLVGLHHLRDAGLRTVALYVEGDNAAALHTYGRLGFARYHLDRLYAHSDDKPYL